MPLLEPDGALCCPPALVPVFNSVTQKELSSEPPLWAESVKFCAQCGLYRDGAVVHGCRVVDASPPSFIVTENWKIHPVFYIGPQILCVCLCVCGFPYRKAPMPCVHMICVSFICSGVLTRSATLFDRHSLIRRCTVLPPFSTIRCSVCVCACVFVYLAYFPPQKGP